MIRVRPLERTDIPSIAEAHTEACKVAYRGILSEALLDRLTVKASVRQWQERIGLPERTNLVVELEDVVVGYVGFGSPHDGDVDPDRTIEVYGLYVHPEHWRAGAGSALVGAVLECGRHEGREEVVLWTMRDNAQAHAFYETHGFAADGAKRRSNRFGETFVELRLRRALA
jgi:ribosomal protein S18 acetylase RimI-like enzyme